MLLCVNVFAISQVVVLWFRLPIVLGLSIVRFSTFVISLNFISRCTQSYCYYSTQRDDCIRITVSLCIITSGRHALVEKVFFKADTAEWRFITLLFVFLSYLNMFSDDKPEKLRTYSLVLIWGRLGIPFICGAGANSQYVVKEAE